MLLNIVDEGDGLRSATGEMRVEDKEWQEWQSQTGMEIEREDGGTNLDCQCDVISAYGGSVRTPPCATDLGMPRVFVSGGRPPPKMHTWVTR